MCSSLGIAKDINNTIVCMHARQVKSVAYLLRCLHAAEKWRRDNTGNVLEKWVCGLWEGDQYVR